MPPAIASKDSIKTSCLRATGSDSSYAYTCAYATTLATNTKICHTHATYSKHLITTTTLKPKDGIDYQSLAEMVLAEHALLLASIEAENRFLSLIAAFAKGDERDEVMTDADNTD